MVEVKRGQATVLVIVGILVFSAFVAAAYIYSDALKAMLGAGGEDYRALRAMEDPVRGIVGGCLEKTAVDGLFFIGLRGGYYDVAAPFASVYGIGVPYYLNGNRVRIPKMGDIEKALSEYVTDNVMGCMDFSSLEGYNFSVGKVLVSSDISAGKVGIGMESPVTIERGGSARKVDGFSQTIDFDLDRIYGLVSRIAEEQEKRPETILLVFVSGLAYDNGFKYVATQWSANEMVFALFFNNSMMDDYFTYAFVMNYSNPDAQFLSDDVSDIGAAERSESYRVQVYAKEPLVTPSEDELEVALMSDIDLESALEDNPGLLEDDAFFTEFSRRLASPEKLNILSFFNGNDEVKREWFGRYGIECIMACRIFSFDGEYVTTPEEKVIFRPEDLEGGRIGSDGRVWLPSLVVLSNGANVAKKDGVYIVSSGQAKFSTVKGIGPVKVVGGTAVISESEEEGIRHVIITASGKEIVVSVEDFIPSLKGDEVSLNEFPSSKSSSVKSKFAEFSGEIKFYFKNSYALSAGTKLTDYNPGVRQDSSDAESIIYAVEDDTLYLEDQTAYSCSFADKKSCIQKTGKDLLVLAKGNNDIEIKVLDNSVSKFVHGTIRDGSKVVFESRDVKVEFSSRRDPQVIFGSPLAVSTGFYQVVNQAAGPNLLLQYLPTDSGFYAVDVFINQERIGSMMAREGVVMKSMKEGVKSQGKWVEELKKKYGDQNPHKVLAYLDDPKELRVLHAVYDASDKVQMDPNFVAASAFGEGLVVWMGDYYLNPSSAVSSIGDIGADRFMKEFDGYHQVLKASDIKVEGKQLTARVTEVTEEISEDIGYVMKIKPVQISVEADSVITRGGKSIFQIGGDIVEVEGDKINVRSQGLVERGLLRGDFNGDDEFITVSSGKLERGEMIEFVEFKHIEPAMEAMGAMLKRRQELFLQDVRRAGFDPSVLSKDDVNFWTYVYYNGGSGFPEDLFGIGRKLVKSRLERFGLNGLKIPSYETGAQVYENAQRILATQKLLDKATPTLESTVLALR